MCIQLVQVNKNKKDTKYLLWLLLYTVSIMMVHYSEAYYRNHDEIVVKAITRTTLFLLVRNSSIFVEHLH